MLGPTLVAMAMLVQVWLGAAYPNGSPASACSSMEPPHGQAQPANQANNQLEVGSTIYSPGQPVTVTVTGTYSGLLLQARRAESPFTPVGTFQLPSEPGVKLLACSQQDDSVTHTNARNKANTVLTWLPPDSSVYSGPIRFQATVASSKNVWYGGLHSAQVESSGGNGRGRI